MYHGFGTASYDGPGEWIVLSPRPPDGGDDTHAVLVASVQTYGDVAVSALVRTDRQLREPVANPWEAAWLLWHYTDDRHFYAFTLKPNGWELSKQDPAYPGDQRFLATGSTPTMTLGRWHSLSVRAVGSVLTVSVDGRLVTRFVDGERAYQTGRVGLYTEDATVSFRDVVAQPGQERAG